MRTALDKILQAVDSEQNGNIYIEDFSFSYGEYEINFMGHYWCFVYLLGHAREQAEYIWSEYSEMLDFIFPETGKSMRTMLSELSDIDLKIICSQAAGFNK